MNYSALERTVIAARELRARREHGERIRARAEANRPWLPHERFIADIDTAPIPEPDPDTDIAA